MDLCGPFNKTTSGFVYILVLKDRLTKWVEIFPLSDKSMDEVAECLVDEIMMRHGAFQVLLTDQGKEEDNKLIKQICLLLGTKKIRTSPYNPRSNGQAENHMRTLKDQLVAYTNAHQNDWDIYLAVIAHAYRTSVNEATGFTPYFMLYGRECSAPSEQWIEEISKHTTLHAYVRGLCETLKWTWEYVAAEQPAHSEEYNKTPRKPLKFREYDVGDLCYVKRIPKRFFKKTQDFDKVKLSAKLQFRYTGPHLILHKYSPILYKLAINGKEKVIHALNMKHE